MPSTLSRQEVKRLAVIGAQSRLDALNAEIASIKRAFPELARGRAAAVGAGADAASPRRRGRGARKRNWSMSAEQKRAVSERMKKYWAARRKEKGAAARKAG